MSRIVSERNDLIPLIEKTFMKHGFEGSTLRIIQEKTGLGRGSLYHFFPGGKEDMAETVLSQIDDWFKMNILKPLKETEDPARAIHDMFDAIIAYYDSGRRICLPGAFALSTRDRFASQIDGHFSRWIRALTATFVRAGFKTSKAWYMAEDVMAVIQGALVLAQGFKDPKIFSRMLKRWKKEII
ncbi:MAG: TetR/AcrR family transcriptional regulator [Spirochaetia bacterium]|nr:TetR/AcrR family transcriptional regulator [Spirochaetia bacterium]